MKGLPQLMRQAQEMQAKMQKAQDELAATEIEGVSGGGMVKIVATCKYQVRRVTIEPALLGDDKEMLEDLIAAAFNDHQRRNGLLGPDAADVTQAAFEKAGATVRVRSTPWRLGSDSAALAVRWLGGWVDAAVEQRPDLRLDGYPERRVADGFSAEIGHRDLLAIFD